MELTASYDALGWRGPRGTLQLSETEHGERNALLWIDAGAFAGNLPRLSDSIAETIADAAKIDRGTVTVEVVYSFAPPIAATARRASTNGSRRSSKLLWATAFPSRWSMRP